MEPRHEAQEAAAAGATTDAECARLRAALEEAEQRATETQRRADEEHQRAEGYLALLQRERADFTNYRRRMEQERADQARTAAADVITALLPALDDLERALAHGPAETGRGDWAAGIRLIERSLRAALQRAGLERIAAEGQRFNPQVHEALLEEAAPGHAEGEVVRELRPGYRLGERVLRPAQVSVAGAPSAVAGRTQGSDAAMGPPA